MSFNFWKEFEGNREELYAAKFGNASCPTSADNMHTATEVLLKRIANEASLSQNNPERLAQLQKLAVSVTETYLANAEFGANNDITKLSSYMLENLQNVIGDNASITSKNPKLDAKLHDADFGFKFWKEFDGNKQELFDAGFGNASCPTSANNMRGATEVLLKRIANEAALAQNKPERLSQLQNLAVSVTETYLKNPEFGANNDISKLSSYMFENLKDIIGENASVSSKHPELNAKLQAIAVKKVEPEKKEKTPWLKRVLSSLKKKSVKDEVKLAVGVGMAAGVMAVASHSVKQQGEETKETPKEIKVDAPKGMVIESVEEYNRRSGQSGSMQPIIADERRYSTLKARSDSLSGAGRGKNPDADKMRRDSVAYMKDEQDKVSTVGKTSEKIESKSFWSGIKEKFNNLFNKKQPAVPVKPVAKEQSVDEIIDNWYRSANQENMASKVLEFATITVNHKLTSEQYKDAIARLPEEFQEPAKHASFCMRTNKKYKTSVPPSIAKEIAGANEAYKARKEREHNEAQKSRYVHREKRESIVSRHNRAYGGGGGLRGFSRW